MPFNRLYCGNTVLGTNRAITQFSMRPGRLIVFPWEFSEKQKEAGGPQEAVFKHLKKTLTCQRETKHFSISVYKHDKSLVLLSMTVAAHMQTFSFRQTNRLCGACVCLWPCLTAAAPKALKLFRIAAIHLLSSTSERLHPGSPTKNTSEVWSAFVHGFKVTTRPFTQHLRLATEAFYSHTKQIGAVITWSSSFRFHTPPICMHISLRSDI